MTIKQTAVIGVFCVVLTACQGSKSVVSSEVTPSGLSYSLVQMPDNPRVSIQIAWPSSWAYQADTNKAAPSVGAELLIIGGSEHYAPGDANEYFQDMQSEAFIFSSPDHTFGTLHFSPESSAQTIAIANAHLRAPSLSEPWLSRIRDGFAQKIAEQRAKSNNKAMEALRWAIFKDQPFRESLSLDEPTELNALNHQALAAWVSQVFRRDAEIVVAGDLDPVQASATVDALFAGLAEPETNQAIELAADFRPKRILLHLPESKTSSLTFAAVLPPSREGSEFEDMLLVSALGVGNQSALFEAIRTNLGASYAFGAGIASFNRETRVLVLTGEVDTEKLAEAEQAVRKAYAAFLLDGPKGDLEDRKKPLLSQLKKASTDTGSMALSSLMAKLDGHSAAMSLDVEVQTSSDSYQFFRGVC